MTAPRGLRTVVPEDKSYPAGLFASIQQETFLCQPDLRAIVTLAPWRLDADTVRYGTANAWSSWLRPQTQHNERNQNSTETRSKRHPAASGGAHGTG